MLTPERLLTQERLKELLDYDPETGVFTWRVKRGHDVRPGSVAGYIASDSGYRLITVDNKTYRACRLAFKWMTGKLPVQCDHRDRDKANDRWTNLRDATCRENQHNRKMSANNKVGLKGVTTQRDRINRFYAHIKLDKSTYLGSFDCPAAAHLAYVVAAHKHFGAFARAS